MSEVIIVALISFSGTILGSLLGILTAQKLTQYRLGQLEEKVEKHNQVIDRTTKLEGRMDAVENEVKDLKAYHKPQ